MRVFCCLVLLSGWTLAGEERLPDALLAGLESPEFAVREEAFGWLMAWARENPERALADLPREHPDPEIAHRLGEIRRHLEFPLDPLWREALAAVGDTPDMRRAIGAFVELPSAGTIQDLARAAGPHARLFWRLLASKLDHPDHSISVRVINELVRLQAAEAGPEIARYLLEGKHPKARHAAADALGLLRCTEAIPALVESLKMDRSTRSAARQALFTMNDPSALPLLARLLGDPCLDARREALGLLNQLKADDPAIVPAVAACLDDKDDGIRSAAAEFLIRVAGENRGQAPGFKERVRRARNWWDAHKDDPEFAPGK